MRVFFLLFLVFGLFAGQATAFVEEIKTTHGLRWSVFQSGLPQVDNLARLPTGELFATLELGNDEGRLVSIKNGQVETLLDGLDRPDGLALAGRKLFVTEEVSQGRVVQFDLDTRKASTLIVLNNPEGIVILPNGGLLITEDLRDGRLLQLSPTRKLTVIARDLSRPEGLSRGADGIIYIAETGRGRVLAYQNNKIRIIAERLVEPDQLAIDKSGNLWIAEDADPGRILRIRNGKTEVMVQGLASPQGMVFGAHGQLYVAEQGRHRILLFTFPRAD